MVRRSNICGSDKCLIGDRQCIYFFVECCVLNTSIRLAKYDVRIRVIMSTKTIKSSPLYITFLFKMVQSKADVRHFQRQIIYVLKISQ